MDIKSLIHLPESNTLEFKRDASSLESLLKSVVAFANTAGGIILVGVEDNGDISGLSNPSKVQEQIANGIAHRIKPQLLPDFQIVSIDEKQILAIQVDYLPAPYYFSDKGDITGVYIRLGNTNRVASPESVNEMKRLSHYPFFDKIPCDNVMGSDLDLLLIQKTLAKYPIDTAKLLSLGILTYKGKRLLATNGGVILFGNPDIKQMFFPYAEVRCARFAGTTRAEFIDRLEIEGGLLSAIEEVPKFIRRNTKMMGKFGAMQRRDIPEYPIDGIREALINALVHANYEISGTRIFVAIYDDRLEIQNPGIMPPGMSIEQFKAGISRIRNSVIARVFGELELIEEWGSGYKRIEDACAKAGYPEPIWEELGTVLRVTFFPHPETQENYQLDAKYGTKLAPSQHQVETLDEVSAKLLAFCLEARSLVEIMTMTGWKDRTKFRNKFLYPLIHKGLLAMTLPQKPKSPSQQYITTEQRNKTDK